MPEMTLRRKLFEVQKAVNYFVKTEVNLSDKYKFVASTDVLSAVRAKMDEVGLMLDMSVTAHTLHEGTTKSGTTRYLTELDITFTWVDVDSGDTLTMPYYAQGVDLAGEKGVGKALTYAEKYFLLKQFHVPTPKDDPDTDQRAKTGEKAQRGTQAEKETISSQRANIAAMVSDLCAGDASKIVETYDKLTGIPDLSDVADPAIPPLYGRLKALYKQRKGKDFKPTMQGDE